MRTLLQGIASFPHILTEEDILLHSYGIAPDGSADPSVPPEASAPEPVVEIPPLPPPALEEPPAPPAEEPPLPSPPAEEPATPPVAETAPPAGTSDPADTSDPDASLSDAELAEKLEKDNTKAVLVSMAEAAGIDQSGNKTELSARLVAHYRAK